MIRLINLCWSSISGQNLFIWYRRGWDIPYSQHTSLKNESHLPFHHCIVCVTEAETACQNWGGAQRSWSGGVVTFILNTSGIGYYILHDNLQFWGGSAEEGHRSPKVLLFLFDWCYCAWLPPSLYLRGPRASLGDCEDRSRSRPLRRKWSGASPRPLRGALPLRRPHPYI